MWQGQAYCYRPFTNPDFCHYWKTPSEIPKKALPKTKYFIVKTATYINLNKYQLPSTKLHSHSDWNCSSLIKFVCIDNNNNGNYVLKARGGSAASFVSATFVLFHIVMGFSSTDKLHNVLHNTQPPLCCCDERFRDDITERIMAMSGERMQSMECTVSLIFG